MANCRNCGALLAPRAGSCRKCHYVDRLRPDLPGRQVMPKPVYSRWKGGPTSFGPVTKVILTVGILAAAPLGGYLAFQILFFISYIPIAGLILWGIWRKQQVG